MDEHPRQKVGRDSDRCEFEVAILCSLPLEATAVSTLFDSEWNSHLYGKAQGDSNAYSTGVIGCHNVVLVHMPTMGKVAAAAAAANLHASFEGVRLALVVDREILLGDVIISDGLVQYDLGRQYPNNRFARKDTPRDNFPRPGPDVRAVLAKLQVEQGRRLFLKATLAYLEGLRERLQDIVIYPGSTEDKLFESTYRHKHHERLECATCTSADGRDDVCDTVTDLTCDQLRSREQNLVPRDRLSQPFQPDIHFGPIASGDTVMKSGEDRDSIAVRDRVIAFEMEGAGVGELFPSVLVIKAACDYADSHKNKSWQGYAAATAAAATKGFLDNWAAMRVVSSSSSALLWVSADPGCGKSVLAKHLVDSVLNTPSRTVCYFFFKDDFDDQRSITIAFCCILSQLFDVKRELLSDAVIEKSEIEGESFTSPFNELWDTLVTAAENRNAGEIVCLLEAIDECEDEGRSQLEKALRRLYGTKRSSRLKFLLTARPYVPNRTYLWAQLTLELIENGVSINESRIVDATSNLPKSVDHAYESILSKSQNVKLAKRLLHIIVAPALPLTVQELSVALTIRESHRSYGELDPIPTGRFYETISDLCGLFVTIIDSRLYLLHQTAKEFLIQRDLPDPHQRSHRGCEWKHSLNPCQSHNILFQICVWHLLVLKVETSSSNFEEGLVRFLKDHPFFNYSATFWIVHFRESSVKSQTMMQTLRKICDTGSANCPLWFTVYWMNMHREIPRDFNILMIASYFGLTAAVRVLLKHDSGGRDSVDHVYGRTPLTYAAWNGHMAVVSLLVRKGANVNFDDGVGGTPLLYATCSGNRVMVEFLIAKGAKAHSSDSIIEALCSAAAKGREPVVRLLLENGTDPNAKRGDGRTLVSWAALHGHEAEVKWLIDSGANVDTVVKLLVENGATLELRDKDGRAPLHWAAGNAHDTMVRVGADIESKDPRYGRTPLSWAAANGYEEVIKLLLSSGACIEHEDGRYHQTPLSLAAEHNHEAVVLLLLDRGADIDARDFNGRTTLSWAVKCGCGLIVEHLLARGAIKEMADKSGCTLSSLVGTLAHSGTDG
ncbi:hypothetical protein BDV28DRAFT_161223 [Aspergillus coremiiformis]|uniref:Nucleoside phosphorylase domain-containing protein n=1 Tax=Aspergillus coremiiformis TaxID=138285 RepID=A0A5N6YSW5_9EURO|nr:hypothetical protein BDV28DRAFT_161223 [Aspergillus coremiiformis]